MRTRDFENYARNQLVINLAMLAVIVSCSVSIVLMLNSLI